MNKQDLKILAKKVKAIYSIKDNTNAFILNTQNNIYFATGQAVLRVTKDSTDNYKDFIIMVMNLLPVDLLNNIDKPYFFKFNKTAKVFNIEAFENAPLKVVTDLFYKLDNGLVDLVVTDYLKCLGDNITRVIKLPKGVKAFVDQNILTDKDVEVYFDNWLIDGFNIQGLQAKGNIIDNNYEVNIIQSRPLMVTFDSHYSMVIAPRLAR